MNSFKTHIEIEVEVFYEFQKAEPQTQSYPGSPAYVDINCIEYAGCSLPARLLEGYEDELEQECWADMEKK